MESDIIPDVPSDNPETYCRLCFSGFYCEPLFPIDGEPKHALIDLIAKHVEINISPETDYPCAVCRMCQMTLESFHKYHDRCRKLDEVLQRRRQETMHIRVKVEQQDELAQNAIGFEEDVVYCLSDSDNDERPAEDGEDLEAEPHEDMEDDADEEDLIRGDILIKPEPYADEYEDGQQEQSNNDSTNYDGDDTVLLDSGEDEQLLEETSTRASSEAQGEDPIKALPFEVTSDGAYKCTLCMETFRLMKEIKIHIRKEHPQASQIYSCKFCAKKFSDTGSLRLHTRFHTMDFPFSCDDCGAKFTMKNRLDNHFARYHDKNSPSYTEKRFKCTLCPRIFLQLQARHKHMKHFHEVNVKDIAMDSALPGSQVYYCETCSVPFESPEECNAHFFENHPTAGENGEKRMSKRYKCNECSKLFRHRTAFRSHVMINHGTMPHKCEICGSCFERRPKLVKHMERWHGENSKGKVLERYKCDQCERFFVRNQDRIRHEQIVHNTEAPAKLPTVWEGRKSNFPCSKCDRKFPSMKTMRIHFSLKHPDVPVRFKCTVCSKLFKHKTTLRDHMANHTGDQPYGCDQCEERFVRKKDLDRHVEEVHDAEDSNIEPRQRFPCGHCPRSLLSKTARALHIRHHHADKEPTIGKQVLLNLPKSLTCSHCKKVFTSRNTLKLHVLNHMGKLPHQCDQCDAGFYKPADLLKHKERYHSEGSPLSLASRFKCAYCPRIFIRKSARRYHHTVFHGMVSKKNAPVNAGPAGTKRVVKPDPDMEFPCGLCTLVFVTAQMLQTHHKQHHPDEEFFFKCPLCPKRTTQRNYYFSHVRAHEGKDRHACELCNAKFDRKVLLFNHQRLYHSETGKTSMIFKCTVCDREFMRNQDRVRHQVTVHKYHVQGSGSAPSPGPSKMTVVTQKPKAKFKIKQEMMEKVEQQQQLQEQPVMTKQEYVEAVVAKPEPAPRRKGFFVSSDVEEIEDSEPGEEEPSVPTISNVVSIKQETIRKGAFDEYPSEF